MGYTTKFKGELKFNKYLTCEEKEHLSSFFNEDCRDHPEWENSETNYVDLEFNNDETGIQWNGAEKSYGMVECINMLTREMRKLISDFAFVGEFLAQGEEIGDVWFLKIGADGLAYEEGIEVKTHTCPECGYVFED